MEKGWSLEYDMTLHHCQLHLFHWSCCFLLLLQTQSSHFLCHCYFLPQTFHYLMNHLTLKGQGSDLGLHSLVMGFQLHPERMEAIHKQSQLHIDQWSMTGFAHLNSHNLSHPYLSSGLGLVVN